MTTIQDLNKYFDLSTEAIAEAFYSDAWRATSFLIQLLYKQQTYFQYLNEENPDGNFYAGEIAVTSVLDMVDNSYNVPTNDDRYETVQALFELTVDNWIENHSDSAQVDIAYISRVIDFVCQMRVHAINAWIEETGPSEDKFEMLRLAKRDAKAYELQQDNIFNALFSDLEEAA